MRIPIHTLIHSITYVTITIYLSSIPCPWIRFHCLSIYSSSYLYAIIPSTGYRCTLLPPNSFIPRTKYTYRRSLWLCGRGRVSAGARLVGMRVRIPPGVGWGLEICLLSVLCVVSSTESYRVWCVQLSVTQKPQTCGGLGPRGLSSHNIISRGT